MPIIKFVVLRHKRCHSREGGSPVLILEFLGSYVLEFFRCYALLLRTNNYELRTSFSVLGPIQSPINL